MPDTPAIRRRTAAFVLLSAAGVAGNLLHVPMFFGVDLLFGSIFVLLAAQFLGPWAGLGAGLIAHAYTVLLWGHPYAYLGFCLEALGVGLLLRHTRITNLVVADALYWLLLGMPLAWFLYTYALAMDGTQALLVTLKQPANGMLNALFAGLLALLPAWRRLHDAAPAIALRDLLLTTLMVFAFSAAFIIALADTRQMLRDTLDDADRSLAFSADTLKHHLHRWHEDAQRTLQAYADAPADRPPAAAHRFAAVLRRDLDGGTRLLAGAPPAHGVGPCTGPPLRVAGADAIAHYHTTAHGCVVGLEPLQALRALLAQPTADGYRHATLLRADGGALVTTRDRPLRGFRPAPLPTALPSGGFLLLPEARLPLMTLWKRARYADEQAIGPYTELRVRLDLALAPFVNRLQATYIRAFTLLLTVSLLALAIAVWVRGRLVGAFDRLAEVTALLPRRLEAGEPLVWPSSRIREIDAITAHIRHTAQLLGGIYRESEARYRSLFESTTDAVFVADFATGAVIDVNPRALQLTAAGREALVDRPLADVFPRAGLDRLLPAVRAGHQPGSVAATLGTAEGDRAVELTPTAIRFRGELRFLALVRDVSERKRYELALVRKNEALSRANTELEQFAHVASHDLKAPLRAVANLAYLLLEEQGDRLDERGKAHLTAMRRRVMYMDRLIDELLAYGRLGAEPDLPAQPVPLAELLEKVLAEVVIPAGFSVAWEPPLPTLHAAREHLETIFRNLIDNAVTHHDRDRGRVRITAERHGAQWLIVVADDGPGIAPHARERVFRIFAGLQPHAAGGHRAGVGLAAVKKLVRRYGGELSVTANAPRGARFCILWPIQPAGNEPDAGAGRWPTAGT